MDLPKSSPPQEPESANLIIGVVLLILVLVYALLTGALND
jgi:hypothetical protein